MYSRKTYVLKKKVTSVKPIPIPETNYIAPPQKVFEKTPPIKTTKFFEDFSRPKKIPEQVYCMEYIPRTTEIPEYDQIDVRVTNAQLVHDKFVIKNEKDKLEKAEMNKPHEFLDWQEKMRKKDLEKQISLIEQRHKALDACRNHAKKSKIELQQKHHELCQKMRESTKVKLDRVKKEIDDERERIRYWKSQLIDGVPIAMEKLYREKKQTTKEIKLQLQADQKAHRKRMREEQERINEHARQVRIEAIEHKNTPRDKFISKVDITKTNFLSALTDKETEEMLAQNIVNRREHIENLITEHRAAKEAKMQEMIALLDEESAYRQQKELKHAEERAEKARIAAEEQRKRVEAEEAAMLALEKRIEKKRRERIKEAEEMEEHVREIEARNRYLSVNKKAMTARTFKAQQDGALRAARDRQALQEIPDSRPKSVRRNRPKQELTNLRNMLGI